MTLDQARNGIGRLVVYRTPDGRTDDGVITSTLWEAS